MPTSLLSDITGSTFPLATRYTPGAVTAQGTSAEQILGALTWAGTLIPSGTITKNYIWTQSNTGVTIYWLIKSAVAGSLVTTVSAPLPSDVPAPWTFASQEASQWAYLGAGGLFGGLSVSILTGSAAGIYKESNGSYSLRATSGSVGNAGTFALGVVSYVTA